MVSAPSRSSLTKLGNSFNVCPTSDEPGSTTQSSCSIQSNGPERAVAVGHSFNTKVWSLLKGTYTNQGGSHCHQGNHDQRPVCTNMDIGLQSQTK